MATSVNEAFRQMFSGWDRVEVHRDSIYDEYRVLLAVNGERLQALLNPAKLVDELWPKRVRLIKSGVRFHGRIVGKR